jgi:hypothetical protein
MRRACLQFIENRVANALRVPPQMRIPEPQSLDTSRLQKFSPFCIMILLVGKTVLAAVEFNCQFRLLAKEIKVVNTKRMLSAEFVASETTST